MYVHVFDHINAQCEDHGYLLYIYILEMNSGIASKNVEN